MKTEPVSDRLREDLTRELTGRSRPNSVSARARHNGGMVHHVPKCLSEAIHEISVSMPEESGHHVVVGGR